MITSVSQTASSTPPKQSSPPMERVEESMATPPTLPNKFQCLKCTEAIFEEEAILMKHLVSMRYFVNELWNMSRYLSTRYYPTL